MDVFEEFDATSSSEGDRRTTDGRDDRSRRRTVLLAALAAVAALVALVGGVVAAAKIAVPDAAPGCDAVGLAAQTQLVGFLQDTVNNTVELGREVTKVGCEPGGTGPGAQVDLIDDAELTQLRATLSELDCPLAEAVPAQCSTSVNGVAVQVDVAALDAADADAGAARYAVTVTLVDAATAS